MNRRQAAKNILLVGAGATLLPYCSTENWPTYENLGLENKAYHTVQALINQILPDDDERIKNMESRFDFVLKQLNDRYAPEDIEQFKSGLTLLDETANEAHQTSFYKLAPEEQLATILSLSEKQDDPAAFCIGTTKRLCVEHFTRSEYFMKEIMDFEFAPGRYIGCVAV